jgi:hypothetical protein
MPTSAALPASITPQTRARRHTRCDKPHPAQRHVSVMTRVTQNSARLQPTQRTSHTRMQNTDTQAPHARTTSSTAATTTHCASITVCTPPLARHSQHGSQLIAHRKTHSHTRPPHHTHVRAVRLPSVDGMLPDSWLAFKTSCLQDTRTAIASHQDTRRRCRPQPAARNASQLVAYSSINPIQSNRMQASQHTACYPSSTTIGVSDSNGHNHTAPRYLTPSWHHTSQRHCGARASHNATTATPCTCNQALGTQQQHSSCKQ